tara:strand:- start:1263 stop:1448 length:186 start_codon:yes stop_codon:yes gene_type:complete
MPTGKPYSSDANKKKIQKAVKDGVISKKQMEKMNEGVLLGMIKKKGGMKKKPTKGVGKKKK